MFKTAADLHQHIFSQWIHEQLFINGVRVGMVGHDAIMIRGADIATASKAGRVLIPLGFEYSGHGTDGMTFSFPKPEPHPFAPR